MAEPSDDDLYEWHFEREGTFRVDVVSRLAGTFDDLYGEDDD